MLPLSRLPAADIALLRRLVAGEALLSFHLALAERAPRADGFGRRPLSQSGR